MNNSTLTTKLKVWNGTDLGSIIRYSKELDEIALLRYIFSDSQFFGRNYYLLRDEDRKKLESLPTFPEKLEFLELHFTAATFIDQNLVDYLKSTSSDDCYMHDYIEFDEDFCDYSNFDSDEYVNVDDYYLL